MRELGEHSLVVNNFEVLYVVLDLLEILKILRYGNL